MKKREKKTTLNKWVVQKIGRDIGYIPYSQENSSFTVWT
jgi:hypothetical protein